MPASYGRYYEPFVGGGALFFRLAPERAVISDFNEDLITTYLAVRDDVEFLIEDLQKFIPFHGPDQYATVRRNWNESHHEWPVYQRASAFIYLNKTCFNGLWRVNRSGEFNVPMGRYKNPAICAVDDLRAASRVLARAEIRCGDFAAALHDVSAGDFVYFDSPYDDTFTAYTADSFGSDDQRRLAETARRLVSQGVQAMLSNSDTPLIRDLYQGFNIDVVKCGRAINSDASKRGAVDELIITGGYAPRLTLTNQSDFAKVAGFSEPAK